MGYASGTPRMARVSQTLAAASTAALTKAVTPIVNDTAGEWVFTASQRPVRLQNNSGQILYVLVNDLISNMKEGLSGDLISASTVLFSHIVANGAAIDLSEDGAINVKTVTVWFPATATIASATFHWFE